MSRLSIRQTRGDEGETGKEGYVRETVEFCSCNHEFSAAGTAGELADSDRSKGDHQIKEVKLP